MNFHLHNGCCNGIFISIEAFMTNPTKGNKMAKAFDLEAAKAGAQVVTRDGRKVIDLHHFERDTSALCLCAHIDGEASPEWFHANGRDNLSDETRRDLFMAPQKRTVYVNLYDKDFGGVEVAGVQRAAQFPTKEDAESNARANAWPLHAVAVPVEIEA